jgi:hypothetical protein
MARTIGTGRPISLDTLARAPQIAPQIVPRDIPFFRPFKGLDLTTPLQYLTPEHTPFMTNLSVDRGIISSRFGIETLGTGAETPLLTTDVEDVVTAIGQGAFPNRIPVRWTTTHVQVYSGGAWGDVGAAFGPVTLPTFPAYTNWGGTVVWLIPDSAYTAGLAQLDPIGLTNTSLGGTVGTAFDLATFGNRVIASCVLDDLTVPQFGYARIKWSVKNSVTDWAGVGSGFEDMISLSGVVVDEVMAVRPINDQTALVIRAHSIWRLDVTGFVDAPFQTSLLTNNLGTEARYTIRSVPGGVIFLGYDDVYIIGLGGLQRIGDPIIKALIPLVGAPNFRACYGYYDWWRQWYWLTFGNSADVYIYSFRDKVWFKFTYPWTVFSIDGSFLAQGGGSPILPEAFRVVNSVYLAQSNGAFSFRENPSKTQDVNTGGSVVDSPIEIRTGLVRAINPLRKVEIVEAQLEYESAAAQTLIFEYSVDGGNSWNAYSSVTVGVTTIPDVISVRKRLETAKLQIRVRSAILGQLKFHALHLFVDEGAMIHP